MVLPQSTGDTSRVIARVGGSEHGAAAAARRKKNRRKKGVRLAGGAGLAASQEKGTSDGTGWRSRPREACAGWAGRVLTGRWR